MDFLPELIGQYAGDLTSPESDLLQKLNRETHLKVLSPRMLSGHLQGRFLSMISHMIKPELIVEIGTYTGYSALCLAEGLAPHGRLITIDNNIELKPILDHYFSSSDLGKKISVKTSNAADEIPSLPNNIDLVFIDADKENYAHYYDLIFEKVRAGGYILADNVLWSGKVTEPIKANDRSTKAIHEFNLKIQEDSRVENILLPIRDGIMMIRKK